VSAAWSARAPRPGDDEGCLARARRAAELAVEHAERSAEEAPKLLRVINKHVTGLCRDTWRCVPPGLSAADAARVRAEHPIWRAVIDMPSCRGWTRLMWAAKDGNITILRSLCDWHAGLEVRSTYGATALLRASGNGHMDCVRELISHGADVNTADINGISPLMYASMHDNIDDVRALLAAGADKRRMDISGITAHTYSVAGGPNGAAIRALLDSAP
jgi:ankyrin repeat protein